LHARVSTYKGDADRLGEAFGQVTDQLDGIDGFVHAYFLVNRDNGKGMSITVWDSEEKLLSSVAKADELRKEASDVGGASIESVEHFEIALSVGSASGART
jgi:heme-degrading monooxygenase HmoA